jgi:hypothetical protein
VLVNAPKFNAAVPELSKLVMRTRTHPALLALMAENVKVCHEFNVELHVCT